MNPKTNIPIRNSFELEELMRKIFAEELQKHANSQVHLDDQVFTRKEAAAFLKMSISKFNTLIACHEVHRPKGRRSPRFLKSYVIELGKSSMN